jgi:transposase
VERAVQPHRQELAAEARATVRFETPPGKQLQIDFGERLVEIGGSKVRTYLFVATLGYSRRHHIRAFRNERQESWFDGLESAFAKFGGVPEEVPTPGHWWSSMILSRARSCLTSSFPSWEAFEAHLEAWTRDVADVRVHGTTGEAPLAGSGAPRRKCSNRSPACRALAKT